MTLDLSAVELELVERVRTGESLELSSRDDREIRADVIRSLVRGLDPTDPAVAVDVDLRGVVLDGAVVVGRLDLDHVRSEVPLVLNGCEVPDGLSAQGAHLPFVELMATRFGHHDLALSAVDLPYVHLEEYLAMDGCSAVSTREVGTVVLAGARIGGWVGLTGATVDNAHGPAINASDLVVGGGMSLDDLEATGASQVGTICLLAATVAGGLTLNRAVLRCTDGPVVNANHLRVTQLCHMNGAQMRGGGELGTMRLIGAHISGELSLAKARLRNADGPALCAELVEVTQDVGLDDLVAKGSVDAGLVRMMGARIGGLLVARGRVELTNSRGPALELDDIRVEQHMQLEGLIARGAGRRGTVRLLGATIDGRLSLADSDVVNASGPALRADHLDVGQGIDLKGLRASGAGERGAVNLTGASARGSLVARLRRESAARRQVILTNDSGPALIAENLTVGGDLVLDGLSATGGSMDAAVNLAAAHVGRRVMLSPGHVHNTWPGGAHFNVDGLTYSGFDPGVETESWLHEMATDTRDYAAQPYRQLAATHQAAGHDGDVRRTLIAQRKHQLASVDMPQRERFWGWFTYYTLGFGYRPWLALVWLLVTAALAVGLTLALADSGLVRPPADGAAAESCSRTEQVLVAVDTTLPLVTTGASDRCVTTTSAAGDALNVIGLVAQFLGWGFATLFAAGFTSAVRKT